MTAVETRIPVEGRASSSAEVLAVLHATADVIGATLRAADDWALAGTRPGQYRSDLAADSAALARLDEAGFGVLSEESGLRNEERAVVVVLDPLDGSTNASHRLPWYATSLCAVDAEGPLAAVVVNLASGVRFEAVRGGGARCDGRTLSPASTTRMADAMVAVSGLPPHHLGWRQFRCLGAAALDLCAVAAGVLDGFIDCSDDAHGVWDYLGALLVCREAGAWVADAFDRELVVRDPQVRRTPVAGATPALLDELLVARRSFGVVR